MVSEPFKITLLNVQLCLPACSPHRHQAGIEYGFQRIHGGTMATTDMETFICIYDDFFHYFTVVLGGNEMCCARYASTLYTKSAIRRASSAIAKSDWGSYLRLSDGSDRIPLGPKKRLCPASGSLVSCSRSFAKSHCKWMPQRRTGCVASWIGRERER